MDKKVTNLEIINDILATKKLEFFKNMNDELMVTIRTKTINTTNYVNGKVFKHFLTKYLRYKFSMVGTQSAIELLIEQITAELFFDKTLPIREVFSRIGSFEEKFYYLLSEGKIVEYAQDHFEIIDSSECKFLIASNFINQVEPNMSCENEIAEILHLLYGFINFKDIDDALIFLIWLLYCFIPSTNQCPINHHILVLTGKQGSGKTTALEIINKIVSPCTNIFESIKNEDDLIMLLSSNYISTFDNIRKISISAQDLLCKACTGGSYTKRKLYTDCETVNINYKSIICLNGISDELASNSDFLDRAIKIELDSIDKDDYKNNIDIKLDFEEALPTILGLIFKILTKVVGTYRKNTLDVAFRFNDFAKFGYEVGKLIDYTFLNSYSKKIKETKATAINGDIIIETLNLFCHSYNFKGTASELVFELYKFAETKDIILPKNISPKTISEKISQYEGTLNDFNIEVTRRRSNGLRLIELEYKVKGV